LPKPLPAPQAPDRTGYQLLVLPGPADLGALAAARPDRYPHWLASTAAPGPNARYDILFAFPGTRLALLADGTLTLDGRSFESGGSGGEGGGFLTHFDTLWRKQAGPLSSFAPPALPFHGGWFLFLGYELAQEIEPVLCSQGGAPCVAADPARLPRAWAERFPAAILYDHLAQRTILVAEPGCGHLLALMQADLRAAAAAVAPAGNAAPIATASVEEEDPARFLEGVRRAKDYISAGDVFQVNLSRAWHARLAQVVPPLVLHWRLAAVNPAPFAALARFPDGRAIVSASPERLVEVRGRRVRTRPIAGTFPRAADPALDQAWAEELRRHPKERAEHIMLVDLERNDLGRVCRPGSVRVSELMTVESYRHVHHLVSEVCGELEEAAASPAAVVRALFPGGTITGCPKVRCMQIIAELEQQARGAYTGALGYVNHDGSLDLNILIRTLVSDGREVWWRAGAGIVTDSVPERELAETRAKARGLLAALVEVRV
jgi:anthranilate synthase component 1